MAATKPASPCCAASRGRTAKKPTEQPAVIRHQNGGTAAIVELPRGSFLMEMEDREGFPQDGEGPVRETLFTLTDIWAGRRRKASSPMATACLGVCRAGERKESHAVT
jgi:hypothetical protein